MTLEFIDWASNIGIHRKEYIMVVLGKNNTPSSPINLILAYST